MYNMTLSFQMLASALYHSNIQLQLVTNTIRYFAKHLYALYNFYIGDKCF